MTDQMSTQADAAGSAHGKVDAAKGVAERTAGRAGDVAEEAQSQATAVARDVKAHVRELVDRGRSDLDDEATARSRQAAGTMRTFADRMGALAEGDPDRAGPLADLVREGQDRLQTLAGRLEDGPSAVLEDVRGFARRQPALFLASAGALGFLAGRFLRAGREASAGAEDTAATGQDLTALVSDDPYQLPAPELITAPPSGDRP